MTDNILNSSIKYFPCPSSEAYNILSFYTKLKYNYNCDTNFSFLKILKLFSKNEEWYIV